MTDAQIKQAAISMLKRFHTATFLYKFVIVQYDDKHGVVVATNTNECRWRLEYEIADNWINWMSVDLDGFTSVEVE